jgi:ADP-heptose:LPS heptosyltransferase
LQKKLKRSRIYLIRKRALGDVLWIEPVIRQLAARYKKVIVHTKYNELFDNYPLHNVHFKEELNLFEKMLSRLGSLIKSPFLFINLDNAYEQHPKMHFLNAYQQKAGLPLTEEYPRIYFSAAEKEQVHIPAEKYVTLHIESFSTRNYRNVYGINWDEIVQYLGEKGYAVIQVGKNPDAIKGTRHVSTSIRDMMVLIKKSAFFIGIDSGPSHIAASLGVPAILFFGSINPQYRHFKSLFKGYILQQPCEFANCYHEQPGSEPVCRLVGDAGIPKCSLHTTAYLKNHIDLIVKEIV